MYELCFVPGFPSSRNCADRDHTVVVNIHHHHHHHHESVDSKRGHLGGTAEEKMD